MSFGDGDFGDLENSFESHDGCEGQFFCDLDEELWQHIELGVRENSFNNDDDDDYDYDAQDDCLFTANFNEGQGDFSIEGDDDGSFFGVGNSFYQDLKPEEQQEQEQEQEQEKQQEQEQEEERIQSQLQNQKNKKATRRQQFLEYGSWQKFWSLILEEFNSRKEFRDKKTLRKIRKRCYAFFNRKGVLNTLLSKDEVELGSLATEIRNYCKGLIETNEFKLRWKNKFRDRIKEKQKSLEYGSWEKFWSLVVNKFKNYPEFQENEEMIFRSCLRCCKNGSASLQNMLAFSKKISDDFKCEIKNYCMELTKTDEFADLRKRRGKKGMIVSDKDKAFLEQEPARGDNTILLNKRLRPYDLDFEAKRQKTAKSKNTIDLSSLPQQLPQFSPSHAQSCLPILPGLPISQPTLFPFGQASSGNEMVANGNNSSMFGVNNNTFFKRSNELPYFDETLFEQISYVDSSHIDQGNGSVKVGLKYSQ